jgi:hypothetical protein
VDLHLLKGLGFTGSPSIFSTIISAGGGGGGGGSSCSRIHLANGGSGGGGGGANPVGIPHAPQEAEQEEQVILLQ